jgi:hypothetical protein
MMNHYLNSMKWIAMMLALCLLVVGCGLLDNAPVGDLRTETESVELGSADGARVHVEINVGTLTIGSGADTLMEGTFEYNVDRWQPNVDYSLNGSQGVLLVEQPDAKMPLDGRERVNRWDLRLNNGVPIDLEIDSAAGEAALDLRDLNLTDLQLSVAAGNATVDLSSALDHDLNASITGGVGNLTVKLPHDMGVRVTADTGIGGLTSSGLLRNGNSFVNEAYGVSPHTLFLDITTGVGAIELLGQ